MGKGITKGECDSYGIVNTGRRANNPSLSQSLLWPPALTSPLLVSNLAANARKQTERTNQTEKCFKTEKSKRKMLENFDTFLKWLRIEI